MDEQCSRCGKAVDKPTSFLTFYDYSNYPVAADTSNLQLCKNCTLEFTRWKNKNTQ